MITASLLTASLTALSALGCSSTNDGGGGDPKCKALTSYTASSGNLVNYMTDIYPILASTDVTTGGCAQVTICHGVNPSGLDSLTNPTKFLQFLYEPANPGMARTNLLTASVNAPGMQRVAPGSVGQSFLAYKISDRTTLACVNAMCVEGDSIGNNKPCGDVMPSVGAALTDAQRTKILDWIAQGAGS
jgi:hypothetical protein